MPKIIVYQNADGSTAVVHPAPQARGKVLVAPPVTEERIEYVPGVEDFEVEPGVTEKRIVAVERKYRVEVAPAQYRDETDEEFLPRVAAGAVPHGVQWSVMGLDDLPSDRLLRNAWAKSGDRVVEDVTKAKALLAAERARALTVLDAKVAEAATKGGDLAEATASLTRVQNILPEINKASTPERLKELLVAVRAEVE